MKNLIICASSLYPIISFVDCVLDILTSIRPRIELCCLVVFDYLAMFYFATFFFVLFVFFIFPLPVMANKVVWCTDIMTSSNGISLSVNFWYRASLMLGGASAKTVASPHVSRRISRIRIQRAREFQLVRHRDIPAIRKTIHQYHDWRRRSCASRFALVIKRTEVSSRDTSPTS